MKFKQFYQTTGKVDFDKMNRSLFENLRDYSFHAINKKGINLYLLMDEESLKETDFYTNYPHLK